MFLDQKGDLLGFVIRLVTISPKMIHGLAGDIEKVRADIPKAIRKHKKLLQSPILNSLEVTDMGNCYAVVTVMERLGIERLLKEITEEYPDEVAMMTDPDGGDVTAFARHMVFAESTPDKGCCLIMTYIWYRQTKKLPLFEDPEEDEYANMAFHLLDYFNNERVKQSEDDTFTFRAGREMLERPFELFDEDPTIAPRLHALLITMKSEDMLPFSVYKEHLSGKNIREILAATVNIRQAVDKQIKDSVEAEILSRVDFKSTPKTLFAAGPIAKPFKIEPGISSIDDYDHEQMVDGILKKATKMLSGISVDWFYLSVIKRLCKLYNKGRDALRKQILQEVKETVKKESSKEKEELQRAAEQKQKEMQEIINNLQLQVDKLKLKNQDLEEQVADYKEIVNGISTAVFVRDQSKPEESDAVAQDDVVYTKRTLLFGGHPKWQQKFQSQYPDVKIIPTDTDFPAEVIKNADLVLINTTYMSHKQAYKFMPIIKKLKKPVRYVK